MIYLCNTIIMLWRIFMYAIDYYVVIIVQRSWPYRSISQTWIFFMKYLKILLGNNVISSRSNFVNKAEIIQKQPPEVFCRKGVLCNFIKFTEKHLCQSLFQVFSCEICKISKNTALTEHLWTSAFDYFKVIWVYLLKTPCQQNIFKNIL